jgi:hypothetical protein
MSPIPNHSLSLCDMPEDVYGFFFTSTSSVFALTVSAVISCNSIKEFVTKILKIIWGILFQKNNQY